jgi:hypothetical protein
VNENCSHELNQSLVELVENEEVAEDFDLRNGARVRGGSAREAGKFRRDQYAALEELAEAEERLCF